jgi:hypothetical protein
VDPKVTRDRNGDAWVAWSPRWAYGTLFTHTYVAATTSAPRFDGSADQPIVGWTLSEPAPESWWAVLRAEGSREFEPVARVRAGDELELRWTDLSAPSGTVLRYRIRRESVDTRYRWHSEEGVWFPRGAALSLGVRGTHPSGAQIELAVTGAEAGELVVRLYDLQGRLVHRRHFQAGGSGQDSIRLDLDAGSTRARSGVYFVKVTDGSGRESASLKLVVLR